MAIKTIKKGFTLYITHRITPNANYIFLNNLRGITLYYKYIKLLNFSHLYTKKMEASKRYPQGYLIIKYYLSYTLNIHILHVLNHIASMIYSLCTIAKSPLHCIMFLSSLIYFVMGISFATALRFGVLLICTQSVINLEPC